MAVDAAGNSLLLDIGSQLLADAMEVRLKVGGSSMFPYLRSGDIAHVVKTPLEALQPGSVVAFHRVDRWVAHRLLQIEKKGENWTLVTRGDSCLSADPPFTQEHYEGQLVAVARGRKAWRIDGPSHLRYGKMVAYTIGMTAYVFHTMLLAKRIAGKLGRMIRG